MHSPLLISCCHDRELACWACTATMSCWAAQLQSVRRGIVLSRSMLPRWGWKTCLEADLWLEQCLLRKVSFAALLLHAHMSVHVMGGCHLLREAAAISETWAAAVGSCKR